MMHAATSITAKLIDEPQVDTETFTRAAIHDMAETLRIKRGQQLVDRFANIYGKDDPRTIEMRTLLNLPDEVEPHAPASSDSQG